MVCGPALPIVGGRPAVGAGGSFPYTISDSVTTTDGSTQTVQVANLAVVGAGVFYYASVKGDRDNGQAAIRQNFWCDASRSVNGVNGLQTGLVGTGFEDPVLQPWSTIGIPAGWGLSTFDVLGNLIRFLFNGAAGQTVRWTWVVDVILHNGAIP